MKDIAHGSPNIITEVLLCIYRIVGTIQQYSAQSEPRVTRSKRKSRDGVEAKARKCKAVSANVHLCQRCIRFFLSDLQKNPT